MVEWIKKQEEECRNQQSQEMTDNTVNNARQAISNTSNWTSPGLDKIPIFWLKNMEELYIDMAREYNTLHKEPNQCPEWLTKGLRFLIPKSKDANEANNYRPITCLSPLYRLLTSLITERIYVHLEGNELLPNKQK